MANHYILKSLCRLYDKWKPKGAKLKKKKKYTFVVHPSLLTGDKNKKILKLVNIPGLHILLGAVDKVFDIKNKEL